MKVTIAITGKPGENHRQLGVSLMDYFQARIPNKEEVILFMPENPGNISVAQIMEAKVIIIVKEI